MQVDASAIFRRPRVHASLTPVIAERRPREERVDVNLRAARVEIEICPESSQGEGKSRHLPLMLMGQREHGLDG